MLNSSDWTPPGASKSLNCTLLKMNYSKVGFCESSTFVKTKRGTFKSTNDSKLVDEISIFLGYRLLRNTAAPSRFAPLIFEKVD